MNNFTRHIPNFLTICNLLSGLAGIIAVFEFHFMWGAFFIWAGALFDFFDGFTARMLKAGSGIGKELDSLADMVTFGILPSVIMYKLLVSVTGEGSVLPYISFLTAVFSAIRLAIFNQDERQRNSFIGMPTPANAFLLSGIPFMADISLQVKPLILNPFVIAGIIMISSWLMVSHFPFFSLKFVKGNSGNNRKGLLIILAGLISLLLFKAGGISVSVIFYILVSLASGIRFPDKTREDP